MNTALVRKRLMLLEAKMDPILFRVSMDDEDREKSKRNTRSAAGAAGGLVLVGSGSYGAKAAHRFVQSHYGQQGAESYRAAGRDAVEGTRRTAATAVKKVRSTNAGYAAEKAGRTAENAARSGASKVKDAVKKVAGKVRKVRLDANTTKERIISLATEFDRLGL